MKKIFVLALVAIATLASSINSHAANTSISMKGDSVVIIDGTDTVIAPNPKAIVEAIKSSLNDTVISNVAAVADDGENDNANNADNYERQRYYDYRQRVNTQQTELVITCVVFGSIIFIVFLCLVFFYMHRRARYRMIEKAIENDYELPTSVAGMYPRNMQQPAAPQPIIVNQPQPQQPGTNQMPPFRRMEASQAYSYGRMGGTPTLPGQYNVQGFKNGAIWAAVGLCLMLFWATVDAEPMVALSAIPVIIGAIKLLGEFFKQRSRIEYERYQMQHGVNPYASQEPVMGQPIEQPSAEQPEQPAPAQPSGEVTPPPFGGPQQ